MRTGGTLICILSAISLLAGPGDRNDKISVSRSVSGTASGLGEGSWNDCSTRRTIWLLMGDGDKPYGLASKPRPLTAAARKARTAIFIFQSENPGESRQMLNVQALGSGWKTVRAK